MTFLVSHWAEPLRHVVALQRSVSGLFAHVAGYIGPCAATGRCLSATMADIAVLQQAANAPLRRAAVALRRRPALLPGVPVPLHRAAVTLCHIAVLQCRRNVLQRIIAARFCG